MTAPFICMKTNYGRDYCYDIDQPQCIVCGHLAAGGKIEADTGIPLPLGHDEPWIPE